MSASASPNTTHATHARTTVYSRTRPDDGNANGVDDSAYRSARTSYASVYFSTDGPVEATSW